MNNFDLKKFLVENRVTTRGRLMFEEEGANLVPLHSIGMFLDTKEGLFHPMKDDGSPDLDPGMAVEIEDANKEEIMAQIDDADKEVLLSVSKELSEEVVDEATELYQDRGYTFTQFYGGEERGRSLQITTPEREYIQIPGGKLGNFMVALEKAASAFYNERNSETVQEGIWSLGSAKDIKTVMNVLDTAMASDQPENILSILKRANKFMYHIVGDDIFHDDLGGAEREAKEGNVDRAHNRLSDAYSRAEELLKHVESRES